MAHTTAQIRNIAITGHAGAGKTSLVEAMLFKLGVIGKQGRVDAGDTVCDFEAEEKEHGHSLNAAFVNFDHEDKHFNVVDTPGFPDFLGQTLAVLPAVDTVAIVIDAGRGVQTTTRRVMKVGDQRKFPRMIIVNRIDEHKDDLEALVETIRETFGSICLPLNLPNADCSDVIDLWESEKDEPTAFGSVADAHQQLVDQIVEVDDALMEKYLSEGAVTKEQLHDAFEKALRQAHLVPIVFTSAVTGAGVKDLLHLMAHLCPSPLEGNPRPFLVREEDGTEKAWTADPKKSTPFVGHVFKITADQFVGKVAMVRVHQGSLKAGDSVRIGDERKPVRIAHPQKAFGKEMKEVHEAIAGDIIAIGKVDELHFDSVIHNDESLASLHFDSVPMPRPMYGLALEAKTRGDEAKISTALAKISEEDPTFRVERIAATHQTVARAMGDLHMRVILEKLHRRFKLDLATEPPKVAYKETITTKAEGHHRHKKQTGGAGQFGEVYLRVEPIAASENGDAPFEFVDDTFGGSVPKQFLPAIEKGVRQAMIDGAVAGYPLTGVRVSVYDGKYHPVDSKEVAFVTAGKRAFVDAIRKAKPVLLEPIVAVEITAPSSSVGDISADLSSKRGQMGETEFLPGDMVLIHAKVPLAEMNAYSSVLKSMTGGQGSFVMDYSHDDRTPPNVQADIIAKYQPHEEED
ncbi:MAG: elongation factor G [Phycisphaerales bacterium]|nr:elongation factor G [Phycisphaerales bacterium]